MKRTTKTATLALLLSLAAGAGVSMADDKSAAPAPTSDAAARPRISAKHWAYEPVKEPLAPEVKQKAWVRTPLDAFVLAQIEAQGLKPSADADRATFIRRATLDAWGVIPTPEEVAAFVGDKSPDAYEKLVDRLLSSPRYGERQARHWLDLARYADSSGFQVDTVRPNSWRYRDYVINAFNKDKPYDRFIKEQIAGDELAPGDTEALIATGFLVQYPDNKNSRDLVQRKHQITTDYTDTVGTAILGSSIGCARCHNHKTDKISMKDYYSLQAFFANTSVDDRIPAPKDEYTEQYEKNKARYDKAVEHIQSQRVAILDSVRDKALKYYKERYLTDSRESIFKPEAEWTPHDRWINHRFANLIDEDDYATSLRDFGTSKDSPDYSLENREKWDDFKRLTDELKAFKDLKPKRGSNTISAVTELGHPEAPPTFVLFGGNHERPLDEVQPGVPEALGGPKIEIKPTATSSGRRLAFAEWLASPENPLTARVFVNRVWDAYFGKGIVGTVSDFGKAGDKPTNPELLDHLASNFVKNGWSVKQLHREILLSSTYRQASAERADVAKVDPENKLLAVFPRKRLDAEQIRDSLLVASGQLNDKVGGPSVFPPLPANLNAGDAWEVDRNVQNQNRRSLYIFTRRSLPYPLLETFDMANPQTVHNRRDVTTTPLQALTLVNSDVVFKWSEALAGRVIKESGNDETAQLNRLYQVLFGRTPDKAEVALLKSFLKDHEKTIAEKTGDGKFQIGVPLGIEKNKDPLKAAAFVDLVHTVANSNDFVYRF